ncbi:DUF2267 domain-containing protein [Nocardioides sp. WL0053]|uniref:DUF2267 domain-containing protein n=1 Tax=Nocardioides jiangsuensis TaxID=2866161 RepID=A0ABS7RP66_9ACTN|nr:DUF2267 domain-containing protein [Nocardioides jiangsuensis]MBY9076302.1 DUF2267 domain-containing protein [Nocardioides jiangsuensis]
MSTTEVTLIEQSSQKTRLWLDELAQELGRPGDQKYALRVLRGFLHTLRDRLPVPETAHLSAQLPEFLRGVFYEGWRPTSAPQRYHDLDAFLERLARTALLAGDTEAAYAAEAVARVLRRHLDLGELHKVRAVLPRGIAALLSDTETENATEPEERHVPQ